MYIRFVSALRGDEVDAFEPSVDLQGLAPETLEIGLFRAIGALEDRLACPEWIQAAISAELAWFNAHLETPERISRPVRRHKTQRETPAFCWFKPEAREHVERARHLAWLVEEAGVPIREIRARNPGRIIWQDIHQIVVLAR
ncbi:MAG: hypothetical protein MRY74_04280 [Neomegalonema sp.]|nr:hypothetical protein [Neomegalonema sp.]